MITIKKNIPVFWISLLLVLTVTLSSCATYHPNILDEVSFMDRAVTKSDPDVQVTVAVLSSKESKQLFGVNLAGKGIQPVWISIKNESKEPYLFLQRTIDAHYYSAAEAAYISHFSTKKRLLSYGLIAFLFFPVLFFAPVSYFSARRANKKIDTFFQKHGIHNDIVMPEKTVAGFVFTPLDVGTKKVTIALYGEKEQKKEFTFIINIPSFKADYKKRDFEKLISEKDIVNYDQQGLESALKEIRCCTTNEKGNKNGDPLNLVIIGEFDDMLSVFATSQWSETAALTVGSAWKTFTSFFLGKTYKYSPISSLYLYGRPQDITFQKARETINERLHLRLWYTPMRFNEKPVWVGQVSRDIGVRFTLKTWNLTTHKIDSNVDDSRDYVLADLAEEERVERYGYVSGVGKAERSEKKKRKNLTGDKYFTDGMRAVIELSPASTGLDTFDWTFSE